MDLHRPSAWLAAALATALGAGAAIADEPAAPPGGSFRLFVRDLGHILATPFRPDRARRREFLQKAGLVLAAGVLLDDPVRHALRTHDYGPLHPTDDGLEPFGTARFVLPALTGLYLVGAAGHHRELQATAFDAGVSVLAASALTQLVKQAAGRSRPFEGHGSDRFEPFAGSRSFPSGHATIAYAVDGAVRAHRAPHWLRTTTRLLASGVALQRVGGDHHWLSDVLAGALLGSPVGRSVSRFNGRQRGRVRLVPTAREGEVGLAALARF